jgi:hypothetical protein
MSVESTAFDRAQLHARLADLAGKGVFIGTSSWKYPGWRGMVYDESRYLYRRIHYSPKQAFLFMARAGVSGLFPCGKKPQRSCAHGSRCGAKCRSQSFS